MHKVILSADSTCDLDEKMINQYSIQIQPLHVTLAGEDFRDGIDIKPDDIYRTYEKEGILPQTSAPNIAKYITHFKKWTDQGYEVIHISLGSALSSAYQNSCLAAEEVGNVHIVDSGNLSTGMGLLVVEAAERIASGMSAKEIREEITELKLKVNTSFVIDKLTYLHEGGRCTSLEAFSANVLNIKPSIEVDNKSGNMNVGKKYRGSMKKVLKRYALDRLLKQGEIVTDKIFITHSGTDSENIELLKDIIEENASFKEVHISRAGCTISSHCGPNTLGLIYLSK